MRDGPPSGRDRAPVGAPGAARSPGVELARLVDTHDWRTTPVGARDGWPHSLRTAVRIALTSRFALWLGWGPELTFFYNDAYAAMTLGSKHPWALGRPAREVWAEIWPQIGPRIERVLSTGSATWDERLLLFLERSGFREETYHTFSYSPLADDDGAARGILCVVTEETERVIGERRLALLHDLASRLAGVDATADVLAALQGALARDARDLPFTVTLLAADPGVHSGRLASTGLGPDHPSLQRAASGELDQRFWPVDEVLRARELRIIDLPRELQWPHGPWEEAPRQAVLLPIARQGQPEPTGVLIAGLNRYRAFDDGYRGFLELLVGQLSAGLASARAYEAERRRAEALAEIDRAKTAFFSNVSHEFRTPLTLMLAPTEDALATGGVLSGPALDAVHRNQLRLLKLVNALLDFARIEAGRITAKYRAVDLAQLTADLGSVFRSAIEGAGLELVVRCEPLPEPVFVDPEMWERIVLNLLSNAFKFTFEGQITLSLSAPEPGRVELSVSDTGVGIPEHELPRVFERFHRIEGTRARTHEGSGIGLALVSDLVRLHGGSIGVDSVLGAGTCFRVTMPTGNVHLPSVAVQTEPWRPTPAITRAFESEALRWLPPSELGAGAEEAGPPASQRLRAGRILVVDDNADMREYLARILRQHWFVELAADGAAALAAARVRRPDLVLTDVMMPRLDGFGLLAALRADPELESVPVIMLSARAGEEARIDGIEAGVDDYLVKPFSARELLARVRTRLELLRLGRRLAGERAAIAQLFEETPMPIAILRGPELVFDTANPAYLEVVGQRDIIGKPLLVGLPELADQGIEPLLQGVRRTGVAHVGREVRLRIHRGGALTDTYWTFIYAPIQGEDGRVHSVIALCSEVTEQVLARHKLEELAREAASANRTKDEFLAMLGHELRNPLAPMLTALQVMRLEGRASREQEVLERQVAHLSRLVDDLLDVSRITRGKLELSRRPVELFEVVARAMEVASPVLEHSHHRVELDVPRRGLCADLDLDRMAQVVSNLLTNAAKYSDARSRIVVQGRASLGRLTLSVKDEGIGIAPEMLSSVFDAFVQQPQSIERARGGLGLGLTIVRSLVEKHGGRVRVESAGLGQGSEFIVELPQLLGGSEPAQVASPAPLRAESAPLSIKKRVLVVDDNTDAAEMLQEALERLGYTVALAHDGPSALRLSESFGPEVALLDIGLPVMDGYELAQRLREQQSSFRAPSLRLIAVTGYGQDRDRDRAVRAGFELHLVKPVDLQKLELALEQASAGGARSS